jgi:UDP-N-acetylglucosamine--N-acetylmuramyl-(pentapeptide) pyrophosphoryl-undecaprenol N-acetylglucosamine transferase
MEGPLRVVVIGGSQGASILSREVPGALAGLPEGLRARLEVSHQARDADHEMAVAAYAQAGITADVQPFFEDVPERLVAAHLVISRSGASSVADISCIGRPSILVPLAAAIRDEQTANARGLVEAGGAILITEDQLPAQLGQAVADILGDASQAAQMADAAKEQGRPDAVDRLKAEVLKLVKST